jgi:hypothetical protein
MSKTNSAVIWLEAEIIRLKRELAEHELARNIMLNMPNTVPGTPITPMGAEQLEKKLPPFGSGKLLNLAFPLPIQDRSKTGRIAGYKMRQAVMEVLKSGPHHSADVILKTVGLASTKQEKQSVYAALSDLKKHKQIDQYLDSRKYHLRGRNA